VLGQLSASRRPEGRTMPKVAQKWWTLIVVCAGIFMLLLDSAR